MCDLHAAREYHKDTIALCEASMERMSCSRESVLTQLREGARKIVQNNRLKLCSILEIITLCGRQNIFFCLPQIAKEVGRIYTEHTPNVVKLKSLCRTRWTERIDAFDRIRNLHSSIVACFESVVAEGSRA